MNFLFLGQKKKYRWKRAKNRYSGMTIRTLYFHVVLNGVIFREISYDIVPFARQFLPLRLFSQLLL